MVFFSVTESYRCLPVPDIQTCRTFGIQLRFNRPITALKTMVVDTLYVYRPVSVRFHLNDSKYTISFTGFITGCQRPGSGKVFTADTYFLVWLGNELIRLADVTFLFAEQAGDRNIFVFFCYGLSMLMLLRLSGILPGCAAANPNLPL